MQLLSCGSSLPSSRHSTQLTPHIVQSVAFHGRGKAEGALEPPADTMS